MAGEVAGVPQSYLLLLIYAGLLVGVGVAILVISHVIPRLLGIRKPHPTKLEPYECGLPSPVTEGARGRVSIRFYLVAILFILFDVETVFLIPWATQYKVLGVGAFVEILVFVGILLAGFVYVWKRGALEWE
jgi:NADH-quinone oxidoreductase subunit A